MTDGVNVSEVHDLLEVVANDGGENAEILWHLIGEFGPDHHRCEKGMVRFGGADGVWFRWGL